MTKINFIFLIGLIVASYLIHKLVERIDALESRLAWLEDRSPHARYIRELEDKEKGWPQATDDLAEIVAHILNENFSHNVAIRTLLLDRPEVTDTLGKFLEALPTDSDVNRGRIEAVNKILKPLERGY